MELAVFAVEVALLPVPPKPNFPKAEETNKTIIIIPHGLLDLGLGFLSSFLKSAIRIRC